MLVIGQKGSDWVIVKSENLHEIRIETGSKPKVMSPFEILSMKPFPPEIMQEAMTASPELVSCRALLRLSESEL
jgi:hypothetical protein